MDNIQGLARRISNLITRGRFEKRNNQGEVRQESQQSQVWEEPELHPYGFIGKAKQGDTILIFHGGNSSNKSLLPVFSSEGAPELEEGDVAVWTEGTEATEGATIICRNSGNIEIGGKAQSTVKGEELKTQVEKNSAILNEILNVLSTPVIENGIIAGTSPVGPISGTYNGQSMLQTKLNAALAGKTAGNFCDILNEKVKHGS